jgi:hypothetical protein
VIHARVGVAYKNIRGQQNAKKKARQEITEVEDITRHPALLDEVTQNYPNSIVVVKSRYPLERCTCAMLVFDFTEKPEYVAIAERGFSRVFAGGDFVHPLLDINLLDEIAPVGARDGDLVVYFNGEGRFKHVGLNFGKARVLSKWGMGHLFEHGLFEVPESYGTNVRFFRELPYDAAYRYFRSSAKHNGMLLDEQD